MRRRAALAIGVVIAAVLAAGLAWYRNLNPAPAEWQGYAEADFVKVGPVQQGLLTDVMVARGDAIAAGTPLFAQDDTADRAARDQAARQLQQAKEQLANLEAAGKPTEIEQAQANLADAHATLDRAKIDLDRGDEQRGFVAVARVDRALCDRCLSRDFVQ